jgi:ATP-dependent Clp protease ATP-binding subunit ClpX
LRSILTEPKNSLVKQFTKLFELEGIKLIIEEDVLNFIVDKAMEYKLGARGLRSICEQILTDSMYELPSMKQKQFVVTLDYAKKQFASGKMSKLKVA